MIDPSLYRLIVEQSRDYAVFLADTVGYSPDFTFEQKVELLETLDVKERLELAIELQRELDAAYERFIQDARDPRAVSLFQRQDISVARWRQLSTSPVFSAKRARSAPRTSSGPACDVPGLGLGPPGHGEGHNSGQALNVVAAGATIVMITHDAGLADQLPRQIRMLDGHVVSDTGGERTRAGNEDRERIVSEEGRGDRPRADVDRVATDPAEAAALGATGAVAGSVVGTTTGQGTEGSLGGAVIGSLVGADLADKVAGEDDDEGEELPPVDFEKLAQYSSGEAEPTIAEQIEEGT